MVNRKQIYLEIICLQANRPKSIFYYLLHDIKAESIYSDEINKNNKN